MRVFGVVGCVGLMVALAGCGGADRAVPAERGTGTSVKATASVDADADADAISVLVTFVGGPADGLTELLPLAQAAGQVTVSGVVYDSDHVPPGELQDTAQGLALVMRPL
ncbi:hypothetical protein [Streptomyces sp. NPDC020917]|uniref:hypothetical protein n=1 Tax=Streptomyces sp. NPDC020917 TaxID=3365102 RepID=UPI00379F985F